MRRAGVRTFAEAENYEADRKRRALEEGGARGDRAHARHCGRADEDDPAILAQVKAACHACAAAGKPSLRISCTCLGRHIMYVEALILT